MKGKFSKTPTAKAFYETEEYKKINEFKSEMNEFKHNLKEEIDNTQNPAV